MKFLSKIYFSSNMTETFWFIKAVSDTVFDMIIAANHDNPLIFIVAVRLNLSRLFLTLY